ncbi:hypothetical protein [Lactococcus petauri]|jgi:hypothetical protein|uniref:rolling circle replication-associated protein n=1 Tax=Lactococcus petauri TaxID=1940789 RepID=UPI0013FD89F3|nr:hypothetical protein [Lactococcus petauri]NHI67123.1 hypothetical protein [Lactococcus garvieae]
MRKFQKYSTKITDFGNYREVTTFHSPQLRSSQEERHKGGRSADSVISDEAQQERTEKQMFSIKRKIRHYILANDFKYFVTLTIDPKKRDSLDYEIAKQTLLKWCRAQRKTKGKFDYIFVPEFHKSGRVHFHGVIGQPEYRSFTLTEATNPKTGEILIRHNRQVLELKEWRYGFTDVTLIEDKERTSSYMTKYISKELMTGAEMFGKKRYFPSRGLKKPEILFIEDEDSDYSDFIPNFGVVDTDDFGNNILEKAIYKLYIDPETGEIIQKNRDSLIKAKEL